MKQIKIEKYECKRCFYEWIPRLERKPLVCPACKSRLWDEARKEKASGFTGHMGE